MGNKLEKKMLDKMQVLEEAVETKQSKDNFTWNILEERGPNKKEIQHMKETVARERQEASTSRTTTLSNKEVEYARRMDLEGEDILHCTISDEDDEWLKA